MPSIFVCHFFCSCSFLRVPAVVGDDLCLGVDDTSHQLPVDGGDEIQFRYVVLTLNAAAAGWWMEDISDQRPVWPPVVLNRFGSVGLGARVPGSGPVIPNLRRDDRRCRVRNGFGTALRSTREHQHVPRTSLGLEWIKLEYARTGIQAGIL